MTSRQRDLWSSDELQPDRAMRYYFHLTSEANVQLDPVGCEFSDLAAVKAHAIEVVREFVQHGPWEGWAVSVINAENEEVLRLSFVDAMRLDERPLRSV